MAGPIPRSRLAAHRQEAQFRDLYCSNNGRPNKPIRTIISILVLKEMFNLTDQDALGCVDDDLRWQVALFLTPETAHCCQKTLHNFRTKLLNNDKAKQLFAQMTDRMMKVLGLFCETIRLFLKKLPDEAKFQRHAHTEDDSKRTHAGEAKSI